MIKEIIINFLEFSFIIITYLICEVIGYFDYLRKLYEMEICRDISIINQYRAMPHLPRGRCDLPWSWDEWNRATSHLPRGRWKCTMVSYAIYLHLISPNKVHIYNCTIRYLNGLFVISPFNLLTFTQVYVGFKRCGIPWVIDRSTLWSMLIWYGFHLL
jgi:hypothetical protein